MPILVEIPKKVEVDILEPKPPKKWKKTLFVLALLFLTAAVFLCAVLLLKERRRETEPNETEELQETKVAMTIEVPSWVTVDLIEVDGASRRGEKLEAVRDLAVHYVANPGTTAAANRNYFNSPESTTSSHFIVGLSGEVILCVPLDEKSSATNERNLDTISIEVCHEDTTGEFSPVTRESLVRLLAWLCEEFGLNESNLIRHYDVTGKLCPLYYVENPTAWEELKDDVKKALGEAE